MDELGVIPSPICGVFVTRAMLPSTSHTPMLMYRNEKGQKAEIVARDDAEE